VRNCPPAIGACVGIVSLARLKASRSEDRPHSSREGFSRASVDCVADGKYKPEIVPTINELFSLRDRVAIVTGGSRGLGQEMAEGLAESRRGADVCARAASSG